MNKKIMKKLWTILLIGSLSLISSIPIFADSFQGVNYTVIEKSNLGSIKMSIDIRLEKKVSKDFLQKLALELRRLEPRKYDRIFIVYLLPGMTPGAGAWATSHFDPTLKVKIWGTTIEEEKILMSNLKKTSGEIIGEWLDDSAMAAKFTLLKKNGKIIMITKFKDGSSFKKEMIRKKESGKLKFEEKGNNDFGEYFLIEKNGNLGLYDKEGFFRTVRAIK